MSFADTLTMRAWSAAAIAAALVSLAAAQQPAFRSGANYVRLDAHPTAGGQPVEDLTATDFLDFEDGKPQTIDTFQHVSMGLQHAGHSTPLRRSLRVAASFCVSIPAMFRPLRACTWANRSFIFWTASWQTATSSA